MLLTIICQQLLFPYPKVTSDNLFYLVYFICLCIYVYCNKWARSLAQRSICRCEQILSLSGGLFLGTQFLYSWMRRPCPLLTWGMQKSSCLPLLRRLCALGDSDLVIDGKRIESKRLLIYILSPDCQPKDLHLFQNFLQFNHASWQHFSWWFLQRLAGRIVLMKSLFPAFICIKWG